MRAQALTTRDYQMSTATTVAPADPIDKIISDAQAYEPTPQEIRWGMIEHHARTLVREIRKGGMLGMTGEAREQLDDLCRSLGVSSVSADPVPLVIR